MWPSALAGLCPQGLWPRTVVIFTTRRSDSESPLSPSDQHGQHPGAGPSVVIEPGLQTSQREGHRPKFKGPRARVGLWPSYPNASL